ncbi:hypothetical protein D3OALGA1CA_1371 [Olavius algarvensis associated proteobacterium Delta 3]|nr:hypothetical protein D3OALGA1CA_1371 [Olavius algarvensis associated proteobacterium Delta 3]
MDPPEADKCFLCRMGKGTRVRQKGAPGVTKIVVQSPCTYPK